MSEEDDVPHGELADAITDALRGPIEPTGGLLADLLFIVHHTPEGQAGRPAAAVGVPAGTWNRWIMYARRAGGSNPSAASRVKIDAAVRRGIAHYWSRVNPGHMDITAKIRWNGYLNPVPNRSTTLDGLNLQRVFTEFAHNSVIGMELAMYQAMKDRYGVPIELSELDTLHIYR